MKKDFLFVNRSKDTFSKPPPESHAIAAHAQKAYQRKLRAQQIQAHQSRTAARASLRERKNAELGSKASTSSTSVVENDRLEGVGDQRLRRKSVASPTSSINEYALSAVPLDKGAYEILQFFLNVSPPFLHACESQSLQFGLSTLDASRN